MEESVQGDYFTLLRFPSVGVDPAHFKDCLDCASWLRRWLSKRGFAAELLYPPDINPPPPPILFAERKGEEGAPTILVYGHYDVQPAEPVSAWSTPPFEPTVADERVYARGAQDDKGQFFALLTGLDDQLRDGNAKATVKIVLEGQEESGSTALSSLADGMRKKLAADILLVCDTSAAAGMRPAIVAGFRGVSHFTLRLTGANRDLHSGEYGGVAPNAAQAMCELLSSLHALDGAIAVPGFRDGIEQPTHDEIEQATLSTPTEEQFAADIGCDSCGGQLGKSIVQRLSFEPTIEINGVHSGYGGPGSKTVIPCEAIAKISMRLVPGQNPRTAFDCVRRHLEDKCPKGFKLAFEEVDAGAPGFRLAVNSPLFRLASEILGEMDARGAVYMWDGASIPVLSVLREASGAAPLVVGWGQAEDRIHSPNESYSFEQFEKARDWGRRIFGAF